MPLPPLPDPAEPAARARGLLKGAPSVALLGSTLLAFNAAQTASLALRPISPRLFRAFNRWAADTWWGWSVTFAERLYGVRIVVTGDPVPPKENAFVVANHQQMADINFLMILARSKERLGDLKWFVKKPLRYVPGIGWGMVFLDCVFVERRWTADRTSIERTFRRIVEGQVPLWLVSFVEGTRSTAEKIEQSQHYAREHDLPELRHVLSPRTKGFVATVRGLRSHIDAVYDVTIGYVGGVPTLWQYSKGFAPRAHLHVRRFPVDSLPEADEALAHWLVDRFCEKDALLDHYYRHGVFPD